MKTRNNVRGEVRRRVQNDEVNYHNEDQFVWEEK